MSITSENLREVMRLWASGVTVVATANADGSKRAGLTVSSFTSVALEPPLILVCLDKTTLTAELVLETGIFAVSLLNGEQAEISNQLAGFADDTLPEGADRFYNIPLESAVTRAPIIAGCNGWLDCTVYQVYDGVTHHIVIGEVQAAYRCEDEVAPLVYFNRGYHALAPEKPS